MKDTMISIASPVIGPEEIDAVNRVLQSGMLAQGPVVAAFEEAFAAYCGTKYAAAVNSGTAAIHAALHAAGVGEGDEVIAPPFTFMATLNPILMLGAIPSMASLMTTLPSKILPTDTTWRSSRTPASRSEPAMATVVPARSDALPAFRSMPPKTSCRPKAGW
jgi:hypothetical protein